MMAEVKWIKITTDMFDNRKIKHLRKLPEGNDIVLIWIMLLTIAGKCNANGMIFLTENIPYTSKMLADELGFKESTVELALRALEELHMIVRDEKYFTIPGWGEHQNVDGLEKIREKNRKRALEYRKRQKLISCNAADDDSVTLRNVTVTPRHAPDIDIEIDTDIEKEEIKSPPAYMGQYMNMPAASDEAPPTPSPQKKKPQKHKYGEYQNVLLSDEELKKLQDKYSDYQERIERLSEYIESKGVKYKSHYATINSWYRREQDEKKKSESTPRAYNGLTEADIHNLDGIL